MSMMTQAQTRTISSTTTSRRTLHTLRQMAQSFPKAKKAGMRSWQRMLLSSSIIMSRTSSHTGTPTRVGKSSQRQLTVSPWMSRDNASIPCRFPRLTMDREMTGNAWIYANAHGSSSAEQTLTSDNGKKWEIKVCCHASVLGCILT